MSPNTTVIIILCSVAIIYACHRFLPSLNINVATDDVWKEATSATKHTKHTAGRNENTPPASSKATESSQDPLFDTFDTVYLPA